MVLKRISKAVKQRLKREAVQLLKKDPRIIEIDIKSDVCSRCGRPWQIGMWGSCTGNPADHGENLYLGKFQEFDFDPGTGEKIRVGSLRQVRELERKSMADYRAGVPGAAPFLFRAFSQNQDSKHYDGNLFGPNPDQKPTRTRNRDGTPFAEWIPTPKDYDGNRRD